MNVAKPLTPFDMAQEVEAPEIEVEIEGETSITPGEDGSVTVMFGGAEDEEGDEDPDCASLAHEPLARLLSDELADQVRRAIALLAAAVAAKALQTAREERAPVSDPLKSERNNKSMQQTVDANSNLLLARWLIGWIRRAASPPGPIPGAAPGPAR